MIRRRYEAELRKRFRELAKLIRDAIIEQDVFGLDATIKARSNARPGRRAFDFPRSSDKVNAFMKWLRSEAAKGILDILPGTPVGAAAQKAWQNVYLSSAYQKGLAQAATELTGAGVEVSPGWIQSAFFQPIHADRAGLIYTRTYEGLRGITDAMASKISAELARGIAEGRGMRSIAADLVNEVGLSATRARMLARTEVIAAHADASLNAYEEAGVEGVDAQAEFATAQDNKVCKKCQALEGQIFTLAKARGVIPVHPNCRCAWIPVVGKRKVRGLK